jgi:hypothetical protein
METGQGAGRRDYLQHLDAKKNCKNGKESPLNNGFEDLVPLLLIMDNCIEVLTPRLILIPARNRIR